MSIHPFHVKLHFTSLWALYSRFEYLYRLVYVYVCMDILFVASVLVPLMRHGGCFSMQMETVYTQRVMFKVPGESLF